MDFNTKMRHYAKMTEEEKLQRLADEQIENKLADVKF